MTAPVVAVTTPQIRALLAARYPVGEWAFMQEVAPRTGGGTRYADAVAVGLWQSRGHAVHGFEIKVSRGDWLREVRDPRKTEESVYRYCDHWFIVTPKGLVKDEEIPTTWGLMEATESKLVVRKPAPRLEAQPVGRVFFASLMRRAHEQLAQLAEARYAQRLEAMQGEIATRVETEVKFRTRQFKDLEIAVAGFEDATGIKIQDAWGGASGAITTYKLAQTLEKMSAYRDPRPMSRLLEALGEVTKFCDRARDAITPFVADEESPKGPTP